MAHDRAIVSFDQERRHAAEYDQNPNRKASVPKECVDHECDSFLKDLILVATLGGPTMFARIGVMRALNRGHVREFNPDRKDTHWAGS